MNPEDLQLASYRGAQFFVSRTSTAGGRKDALKEFVGSDLQLVEDLGLLNRTFTINGTIAPRLDNRGNVLTSYQQIRDTLLAALEKGEPGILIHPFFGRMENIVARSWSIDESVKSLGDTPISIVFAISNTTGRPIPATSVISKVQSQSVELISAILNRIADAFGVTPTSLGNFDDALTKMNDFSEVVRKISNKTTADSATMSVFNEDMLDFESNMSSYINEPINLAVNIDEIFDNTNNLFDGPEDSVDTYKLLFDYGDGDETFPTETLSAQERQMNRDVMNNSVQAMALCYSYLNASLIDYETVEHIEATSADLEAQFQKLFAVSNDIGADVLDRLLDLRITTQSFFDAEKLNARQVIEVRTNPTSTNLLAYQYYGSSELGDTIGELNGLLDATVVDGNVSILTE